MRNLLFLFLLTTVSCSAQYKPLPLNKGEYYDLKVGNTSMRIDAANGARITSLRYDTIEVLSQNPMPNMYGSTFWTSPQKEWNWPPVREHDIMQYDVEKSNGKIIMTSQLSQKIPLRIRKQFAVDKEEECFVITYSIINEGNDERKVAPWEITRVPAEGIIFFDAPMSSITPAGLMNFIDEDGLKYYAIDQSEKQRKINADGKGWLGYRNNGLLFMKYFDDLDASQAAPDEAEIQVYVHNGKVYVELEAQGAYTTLKPGERLDWTVKWKLTSER